jgi:ferredoxin-NADP reductase
MIKIYRDHQGVTNMLGQTNAGADLILHDVFGAIRYKDQGIFIAGGAAITPFISIFRDLYHKNKIEVNRLIYSNKTSNDVIMQDELQEMLKDNFIKLFTLENVLRFRGRRIDRSYLFDNISDFRAAFLLMRTNCVRKKHYQRLRGSRCTNRYYCDRDVIKKYRIINPLNN